MSTPEEVADIVRRLSAPFDAAEIKVKPTNVKGNRCLALHYVDARVIQDRLDEVLGVLGWQDSYKLLPDGSVLCRLRLRIGDQWITKVDVGGQSEQPDGGDRMKAAVSDALKRAAVKFGIGRYLYRLPSEWMDYDPQRRCIVNPNAAKAKRAAPPAKAPPAKPAANGTPAANGEDLDRPIGPEKAAELRDRCEKLGWPHDGPNGWLAWLGRHPTRAPGEITRRQARAVYAQAQKLAKGRAPAQAPAPPPAPAPETGECITDEQRDELTRELHRTGKPVSAVWRRLRVNVEGDGDLAALTMPQWREVLDSLRKLPDAAPAPTP